MSGHWLLVGQWVALVGGLLVIPLVVARLPEPPPVVLPDVGSAE